MSALDRFKLRKLFDRWSEIEDDKDRLSEKSKELFADARGQGFDGKPLRAAFQLKREYDADPGATQTDHEEVERLLEALGVTAELVASARSARESYTAPAEDRPLTIKERAQALAARAAARARGEPVDDEIPDFLRRQA